MSARTCGKDPSDDDGLDVLIAQLEQRDIFDGERVDCDVEHLELVADVAGCTWTSQRDRDAEERFYALERETFNEISVELHLGADEGDEGDGESDDDDSEWVDVEYLMTVNGAEICTHTERVYLETPDED